MRTARPHARAFPAAAALLLFALSVAAPARAQDHTFGVEIHGVLCGYVEIHVANAETAGKPYTLVKEKVFVTASLLGSEVNTEIDATYHLPADAPGFSFHENRIRQGEVEFATRVFVEGRHVRFEYPPDGKEKSLDLPPGAVLENPIRSPHLIRDFVTGDAQSKTYPVLDVREAAVHETRYTRIRREAIELAEARHDTLVLDRLDTITGVRMRQWLGPTSRPTRSCTARPPTSAGPPRA